MSKKFNWFLLMLFAGTAFLSCENQPPPVNDEDVAYFEKVAAYRQEKDDWFRESGKSPLLSADKAKFEKLPYFPISPAYRYTLPLAHFEQPDTIVMLTSRGLERKSLRYGRFEFEIDGTRQVLSVYKFLDLSKKMNSHLFVPFLDQSAGEQTYGGGRYIDLYENETDIYHLDFNFAYNPNCAYGNKEYSCPLPPSENTLSVEILAGEKKWR